MKREGDALGGSRDPYIMRGGACDLCGVFFGNHYSLFGTTKVHPGHSRDKALLHLVKVPRRWIKKLKGPSRPQFERESIPSGLAEADASREQTTEHSKL